jgi:hypothetical protein
LESYIGEAVVGDVAMKTLTLVRLIDTSGGLTGIIGDIRYQALTEDELDLYQMRSDYSFIGQHFSLENLGKVQIPSLAEDT